MHLSQLITMIMLAAASTAAPQPSEEGLLDKRTAGKCTPGQTYCGKFLKKQGSSPNQGQNLGWDNNDIFAALDNPAKVNLTEGGGIVNRSLFVCKNPRGGKNRLDWLSDCGDAGCGSYPGNNGNDRCNAGADCV